MKIKICGITNEQEINILNELQVDYAGFVVFFDKSKRNNTLEAVMKLKSHLDKVKSVAVVVSPSIEQAMLIEKSGFDVLQIHGEMLDEIKNNSKIEIWRAINIDNIDEKKQKELRNVIADDRISGIVLDGANAGSGKTFDWKMAGNIDFDNTKFILAGGLNPDNVATAINELEPDIVDVSSGVEYDNKSIVGKDREKVIKFVENARNSLPW